ncbi:hypothetical protein [Sinorhizobium medicae]|nr:hypothetical protein [Sinorhizobium medicae]
MRSLTTISTSSAWRAAPPQARHATILAQIIKLGQKLTDGAAVTMFI